MRVAVAVNPHGSFARVNQRQWEPPTQRKVLQRSRWVAKACLVFVLVTSLTLVNLLPLALFSSSGLSQESLQRKLFKSSNGVALKPVKDTFAINEQPAFRLSFAQHSVWKIFGRELPFGPQESYAAGNPEIKTAVWRGQQRIPVPVAVHATQGGTYLLTLNTPSFKIGTYTLEADITANHTLYHSYQDFSWGVLAINTTKSISHEIRNEMKASKQ